MITEKLAREEVLGKASKKKCMVLMNGERETVVWNCSCVNTLKGTVLDKTVPRHYKNGKPIRTYAERFHTASKSQIWSKIKSKILIF